jgi:hypothetical protein
MFLELEQQVSSWESDEARDAYVKHLGEMDLKWDKLVKLNVSVMTVVVAATADKHKVLAHELCEGIMGMMGRMCEAWAFVSGNVISTMPEQQDIYEESKVVDKLGMKLGETADAFLGVILVQMLLPLIHKWSELFTMAAKARNDAGDVMNSSDAMCLSSSCSEELRNGFEQVKLDLMSALRDDSSQLDESGAWVLKARPRFELIVRTWGQGSEAPAMAAVVSEMGFPDATR